MSEIGTIKTNNGTTLFFETTDENLEHLFSQLYNRESKIEDLPAGSEAISAVENTIEAFNLLKSGIGEISNTGRLYKCFLIGQSLLEFPQPDFRNLG